MIRSFMRVTFPKLIDILFILSLIGNFLAAIMMASFLGSFSFLTFIVSLLSGTLGIVLLFGGIYVLFDIRDTLFEMKE